MILFDDEHPCAGLGIRINRTFTGLTPVPLTSLDMSRGEAITTSMTVTQVCVHESDYPPGRFKIERGHGSAL